VAVNKRICEPITRTDKNFGMIEKLYSVENYRLSFCFNSFKTRYVSPLGTRNTRRKNRAGLLSVLDEISDDHFLLRICCAVMNTTAKEETCVQGSVYLITLNHSHKVEIPMSLDCSGGCASKSQWLLTHHKSKRGKCWYDRKQRSKTSQAIKNHENSLILH